MRLEHLLSSIIIALLAADVYLSYRMLQRLGG